MNLRTDAALSERLQYRLKQGDSGTLAVVFSQVRVPAGKFGLERLFARTRHNCLFFNDTANGWYLGHEGVIDTAIGDALSRTNTGQIIYYGSSMGGYGALATGLRRRDGAIHAFGPELRAGYPGSQSQRYGISPDDPRLFDFKAALVPLAYPVHLYFGIYDAIDAVNAAAASKCLPSAHLHLLRSCHASHDHLYSLNLIRRIISTFSRDPETELASKHLITTADIAVLEHFGILAERLAAGEKVPPEEVLALEAYGENPGMMRLAAEVYAQSGAFSPALEILEQAEELVETDPILKTLPKRWRKDLPLRRVEFLLECGSRQAAQEVLAQTATKFSVDERMLKLAKELGTTLSATGQPAE